MLLLVRAAVDHPLLPLHRTHLPATQSTPTLAHNTLFHNLNACAHTSCPAAHCSPAPPLQALAVIQHSAALQADAHSQAVATSTLSALVPAWLAAGRGSEELWGSLLGALPGLPAHRRLGLLESLLAALPQVRGLWLGVFVLVSVFVSVWLRVFVCVRAQKVGGVLCVKALCVWWCVGGVLHV